MLIGNEYFADDLVISNALPSLILIASSPTEYLYYLQYNTKEVYIIFSN